MAGGAIAQAVAGMGFALVAAPALLMLLGPRDGVGAVMVLATLSSLLPLTRQWRSVRVRDMTYLLIPTLLATPLIGLALVGVDTGIIAVAAGIGVLVGVVMLWRGANWQWLKGVPGSIAAGVCSAALNVIGGVGGPPIGLYAANAGWEPEASRATLQGFFLIQNIATIFVVGLIVPQWWMFAALVVGTVAGTVIAPRVPANAARLVVLGVAAFGGIWLVLANI